MNTHTERASTKLVNNVKHPRQMVFRITYESNAAATTNTHTASEPHFRAR